jgi:hypothetical protein
MGTKTLAEVASNGIGRPGKELTPEYMSSPDEITKLLNRTRHLTDEAFEDLVHDIGYRMALLVLRAKAVSGDTKAIDLYFKVVRETRAARRKKDSPAIYDGDLRGPDYTRGPE